MNDGRSLTRNPCFVEEWGLALRGTYAPAVYVNMNLYDCEESTPCDAYQYGRLEAAYSHVYAMEVGAEPSTWWLDVQIVSDWSTDLNRNAASIRGAIDYLHDIGARVAISSTSFQWTSIVGDYTPGLPIWDAGELTFAGAYEACATGKDFAGGMTEQIAYVDDFEVVLACDP